MPGTFQDELEDFRVRMSQHSKRALTTTGAVLLLLRYGLAVTPRIVAAPPEPPTFTIHIRLPAREAEKLDVLVKRTAESSDGRFTRSDVIRSLLLYAHAQKLTPKQYLADASRPPSVASASRG